MKKFFTTYGVLGFLMILIGMAGSALSSQPLAPALIFLGSFLVCWQFACPESLFLPSDWQHVPHESLRLTRLFLMMSYDARRAGILELCERPYGADYRNPSFHKGMGMIIDGMDPEFVSQVLSSGRRTEQSRFIDRVEGYRQIGMIFCMVAIFGLGVGSVCYGIRYAMGDSLSWYGMLLMAFLGTVFLLAGLLFRKFLSHRFKMERRMEQQLFRQTKAGVLSLQRGDSPGAIVLSQMSYLSFEEQRMLCEQPFPEEMLLDKDLAKNQTEKMEQMRQTVRMYMKYANAEVPGKEGKQE